jgi:hypothetical protein
LYRFIIQYSHSQSSRLQTRTSESQLGVRRRIHILAQVDARLAILPENVDVLGLEPLARASVGTAEREHLVARERRQVLLVPARVGDTGTVSRLVRVDVARPVFELEVLEDDGAVVDSRRAWVVLVDVGLRGLRQLYIHTVTEGNLHILGDTLTADPRLESAHRPSQHLLTAQAQITHRAPYKASIMVISSKWILVTLLN